MVMTFSLPETFAKIPRYPLLYSHPSPIHPLPNLTTHLLARTTTGTSPYPPPSITLFAKREDQCSPLACSGNKYRKLEYIVPHIQQCAHQPDGSDIPDVKPTTLVTEGAVQSNHTVQVAALATRLGLDAVVVLHKATGGGLASTTDATAFLRGGNVHIDRLLGSEVRMLESDNVADDGEDPIAPIMADLTRRGKVPYWIPSGASLHPLGGLGYARCAFEIAAQEKEVLGWGEDRRFDYVFVACGSGSTVAGLVAGFKLLERMEAQQADGESERRSRRVIGILNSPTKPREYHEGRVLQFARRAAVQIGLESEDITLDDIRLDDRFAGTGYGILDPQTKETLALVAQREGMLLDPVYTAKVATGVAHWVQRGDVARDWSSHLGDSHQINALFIHTGGQSALGAYADIE